MFSKRTPSKELRVVGKSAYFILLVAILFTGVWFILKTDFQKGNYFFGEKNYSYNIKLAEYFYKKSVTSYVKKDNPEPVDLHYQLGRIYFIKGDLYTALEHFKREEGLYPDNAKVFYMEGLTYGYLNLEELAIVKFGEFIKLNPTSWAARNDKAWLEFRIGDIDAALTTIAPVAHDANNPWVQNTYGTLLMNQKDYSGAKEAYLNAKRTTDSMSEKTWGGAYPGNDPRIYGVGLSAMKQSIANNLELLNSLTTVHK